jgi:hypothetical protein
VTADHLRLLLSFAVGGLLGDVFLHLLPEAWSKGEKGMIISLIIIIINNNKSIYIAHVLKFYIMEEY